MRKPAELGWLSDSGDSGQRPAGGRAHSVPKARRARPSAQSTALITPTSKRLRLTVATATAPDHSHRAGPQPPTPDSRPQALLGLTGRARPSHASHRVPAPEACPIYLGHAPGHAPPRPAHSKVRRLGGGAETASVSRHRCQARVFGTP